MQKIIIALAFSVSTSAMANQIYICTDASGKKSFQQTECSSEQEAETKTVDKAPVLEKVDIEGACLKAITSKHSFKDPRSAIVESTETIWLTDKSGARRVLRMSINSKNSYGAYAGASSYFCFLSADGERLSTHQRLIN